MIARHESRQELILSHIEQLLEALRQAHGQQNETYRSAAKAVRAFQRSILGTKPPREKHRESRRRRSA